MESASNSGNDDSVQILETPVPASKTEKTGGNGNTNIAGLPQLLATLAQADLIGLLYSQRIQTFDDKHWTEWERNSIIDSSNPTTEKKRRLRSSSTGASEDKASVASSTTTCTPHELAMAGFYLNLKKIKCCICHRTIKLKELVKTSDPWKIHQELNPKCALIKLGKPDVPDGYTMANIISLIGESQAQKLDCEYVQLEKNLKAQLEQMKSN